MPKARIVATEIKISHLSHSSFHLAFVTPTIANKKMNTIRRTEIIPDVELEDFSVYVLVCFIGTLIVEETAESESEECFETQI